MKKGLFLVVLMVATLTVWAQVPQTLTYQAVVRDGNGRLICNSNVGVKISILQGSEDGVAVYSDQQTVRTNANGLFSLLIGTAENSISGIDWAAGPYFLKSEIDHTGGSNYTLATVQQMFSVPYALRAHTVDSIIGGVNYNETDPVFTAWDKDYNDLINKPTIPTVPTNVSVFNNDAGYLTSYTEVQSLGDVTAIGNTANSQLKAVSDPTEALDAVNLQTLNAVIAACQNRIDSITHRYDSIIANCLDTIHLLMGGFDADGASRALFSVSDTKKVRFSKGNLQFTTTGTHATADGGTAVGTWRFAEHQYDYIGEGNANISSTYTGWIDLFGWGTSGWNSGANAYQPWSTSTDYTDYYPGGSYENDLTGDYANADWGVYNAISNGGNVPGMWRTFTRNEIEYMLFSRPNNTIGVVDNGRFAKAQVVGVSGIIIFSDNYIHPENISLPTNVNAGSAPYSSNIYNASQWKEMEAAGAVFWPAAGYRHGATGSIGNINTNGGYRTTESNESNSDNLDFGGGHVSINSYWKCGGGSIRLVKNAE